MFASDVLYVLCLQDMDKFQLQVFTPALDTKNY
jgi:hypothetical protein